MEIKEKVNDLFLDMDILITDNRLTIEQRYNILKAKKIIKEAIFGE